MWCALAQITINKGQGMLAQITRNIFSMKRQGQKFGVCWHKSQKTIFFYGRTRTKMWRVLAQITKTKDKMWK